jgi:hypothetical protein
MCGDQRLVAELTSPAAKKVGIVTDCDLFAVKKASAFQRLG